jgi:hypothetical protein
MLALIAAVLFAIGLIIYAASISVSTALFQPTSFLFAGLICVALHLNGIGTGWSARGRGRR